MRSAVSRFLGKVSRALGDEPEEQPKPDLRRVEAAPKKRFRVTPEMVARAKQKTDDRLKAFPAAQAFKAYQPPEFVCPKEFIPVAKPGLAMDQMAQDNATNIQIVSNWASAWGGYGAYGQGYSFQGYQELALLAQVPEYRRISEVIATEMTRKWIRLTFVSDDDEEDEEDGANDADLDADVDEDAQKKAKTEKSAKAKKDGEQRVKELEDELKRLGVQGVFRKIAELDGFFGRAHLYFDIGDSRDNREELMTDIGSGLGRMSKSKLRKGTLNYIRAVEPVWTYPSRYNSSDPLREDWYTPQTWFVMGKELHVSRLLTFIGREVPDLLKPAFSFGGLSLSQMAKPYVDNWLRTRQSVADIINAFSVFVLSSDLSESLTPDGSQLFERADLFNLTRNNRGLMMLDKDSELFQNVAAPLGTLDALQAQTQEHMSAVSGIPLVKLLGIQPAGLNASSEGEIRTFYDNIHAFQEKFFTPNLTKVIHFAMLNIWGEVDERISFTFEPLWSLDEKALAEKRKTEMDTDGAAIDKGILSPEEVRQRLASDPDTPYQGLDPDDVPEPPEMPEPGNLHERIDEEEDGPPQKNNPGEPNTGQKAAA